MNTKASWEFSLTPPWNSTLECMYIWTSEPWAKDDFFLHKAHPVGLLLFLSSCSNDKQEKKKSFFSLSFLLFFPEIFGFLLLSPKADKSSKAHKPPHWLGWLGLIILYLMVHTLQQPCGQWVEIIRRSTWCSVRIRSYPSQGLPQKCWCWLPGNTILTPKY